MQNDLCLNTGDSVRIGNAPEWFEIVVGKDIRPIVPVFRDIVIDAATISEVKYKFRFGDNVQDEKGWTFVIENDQQAEKHNARQANGEKLKRVGARPTPEPVTMTGAKLGEIWADALSPDIFHVEKRLKPGKCDVGGLTVEVAPSPDHKSVMVRFISSAGKNFNAEQLRSLSALLNEIADCL